MIRFFAILVGVTLLVGVALSGSYVFDSYAVSPDADAPTVSFTIAEGDRGFGVAQKLEEAGLIDGTWMFRAYLRFSGTGTDLKPGTFELRPGMSYASIVSTLSRSDANEVQITIPEGFTLKQTGERVREALPRITENEWNVAAGAWSPVIGKSFFLAQSKPATVDLEGYLFPDTYRFFSDASAEDVVLRMVETMESRLTESLGAGDGYVLASEFGAHEVLTLASIVEREVRGSEDMKYVADIFLSRLKIGMPLQADSTISYYLGKTSAELTTDDLRSDEPFNTYTRAGLPPGPISNPGLNAIDAVLRPIDNPYLYFLTASDGTVIYASTFEEHVANKSRYLR
ncbi:hypothetical protein A2348_05380 [Candidatus Uhrbacteria bacterium RIFOXYB12_FULL_58_10]|uniref:Endolytic murein transglycosylase n=1 Tax=Candidatus Uhrbacteria bacterium RIFOXYB2_FULL_57_15 TaxID=1802422 RepID=A0A1F7W954_9BACT|nr:MAG: hypothetical protein A2348_05380 [Candidatus Uhrbacteria bacterium RIFOXYB12_FULL_58_10]OGL98908.1 MAG: hypothetical protein A2304_04115 [Candidatus Uhrbacteria bacterium RIFOXYB2_FULL_57_15]